MKNNKSMIVIAAAAILIAATVIVTVFTMRVPAKASPSSNVGQAGVSPEISIEKPEPAHDHVANAVIMVDNKASGSTDVDDAATTEAEAKAEKLVDAFDALTDKWMETEKGIATLADVPPFVAAFKALPQERQDECIHRALNLIPDENIMLLVGVLMDKSVDPEIVETVFSDILNRDEAVKQPIMKEIYKDKTHKCWADVAWILDVTGES